MYAYENVVVKHFLRHQHYWECVMPYVLAKGLDRAGAACRRAGHIKGSSQRSARC